MYFKGKEFKRRDNTKKQWSRYTNMAYTKTNNKLSKNIDLCRVSIQFIIPAENTV